MKLNKLILTALILILAFPVMAAGLYGTTTGTIRKGDRAEFYNGRAGVAFTSSQYSGIVRLARMSDSRIEATNHPKFTLDLVSVSVFKTGGDRVRTLVGAVYVFFIVNQKDVRAWREGELDLYYYDSWHGEWAPCDSFLVTDGEKPRIACRMNSWGTFGLAEK